MLTPRNVQAFRTVFNMTHALFEVLGPKGWHLVLSTLAVLDAVLCSPATTTLQKATSASAEPEKHSELSVLDTATVQLFATTAFASEATVDTMMHTLLGLSQSSVERVQVCFHHLIPSTVNCESGLLSTLMPMWLTEPSIEDARSLGSFEILASAGLAANCM